MAVVADGARAESAGGEPPAVPDCPASTLEASGLRASATRLVLTRPATTPAQAAPVSHRAFDQKRSVLTASSQPTSSPSVGSGGSSISAPTSGKSAIAARNRLNSGRWARSLMTRNSSRS